MIKLGPCRSTKQKKAGDDGVTNEHYKYANSEELKKIVQFIMETIINTGVIPDDFNTSIIKPLIKDKKKQDNDPDNTRPISISRTITNKFEKVILRIIDAQKLDVNEQFGFKSKSSCNHAITILLDAVRFNWKKSLRVNLAAIDATKAFDKVNRQIMWAMMIDKVDSITLRTLIRNYDKSEAYVENGNDKSIKFKTSIGVKQGGAFAWVQDFSQSI